jgi:hypothetical protein
MAIWQMMLLFILLIGGNLSIHAQVNLKKIESLLKVRPIIKIVGHSMGQRRACP